MKYWRTPLDLDRVKIPRGTVHIIIERCKGCSFCIEYCPKDVLAFSEDYNRKGYHYPKVLETGLCVNCNLCEMICPDFAIFSLPEPDPADSVDAPQAAAAIEGAVESAQRSTAGSSAN